MNPNEYMYFLLRGDAYESLRLAELARQDYIRFQQLHPEYEENYLNYIQNLETMKLWDEAEYARATLKKLNFYILGEV